MTAFNTSFGEPVKNENDSYVLECLTKAIDTINAVFMLYGVNEISDADNLRTVILQHIQRSSKLNAPKKPVGRPRKTVIPYKGTPL